jgi:hypothetical protein
VVRLGWARAERRGAGAGGMWCGWGGVGWLVGLEVGEGDVGVG